MKKLFIIIVGLLSLVIFYSCSSTRKWRKELEKEWLGKTRRELIYSIGTPNKINIVAVPGTEILIYIHEDYTPDILPNTYTKDFFVNKDSVIYKIETYSW